MENKLSDELRREYKRLHYQRKKAETAAYAKRYWESQSDQLEESLLAINEVDLIHRLKTSTGAELTAVVQEALEKVKTLPSAFIGKGGRHDNPSN